MNSDAHTLDKLGRNSEDDLKITRLKMDELSFKSFKIAFLDPMSRMRIEDLIPKSVPHFYGVKTSGGFLGNQTINLSKNLTCIIGGRGAGKSTLLQSVKAASGNTDKNSDIVDSEVWPDRIKLVFEDGTGEKQVFVRDVDEEVLNKTNPDSGITKIPIESYGQGKTADIIQHASENPKVLLDFFDEFIELEEIKNQESEIRGALITNRSDVEDLRQQVNQIPEIKKIKQDIERKLKTKEKKNVGELVKLEKNLQQGRQFRQSIVRDLKEAIDNIKGTIDDKTLLEQVKSQDIEELKVGETQYDNIIDQVDELYELLEEISDKFSQESKSILHKIKKNLKKWSKDESKILEKIDEKKEELEEQGIQFDLAFIKQLAKDDAKYKKKLKKLNTKKDKYKKKLKSRDQLFEKRKELRTELYKKRYKWAIKVNDLLEKTVVDFFIKIEFGEGLLSETAVELIKDKLNWYKTKKPRIRRLTRLKNPFELYDILEGKKKVELKKLKDNEGNQLFSDNECREIIEKLNKPQIKQRLQELKFNDFPKLHVTKVEEINGEKKYRKKDFTKLSLGQQQSILLSILLYSDNKYPLLIDQPEDNLDSEFIYKTIVSNLKRVKERRQVIIVTHNPNIAVLGDAELIIPLKSTSEKAHIIDRGSIDNAGTKDITCKILEGSKSAFRQRKEIYGL